MCGHFTRPLSVSASEDRFVQFLLVVKYRRCEDRRFMNIDILRCHDVDDATQDLDPSQTQVRCIWLVVNPGASFFRRCVRRLKRPLQPIPIRRRRLSDPEAS